MEIFYEHHYGRMSDCDVAFCLVLAKDVKPEEEKYALENGWNDKEEESGFWGQGRSVRMDVSFLKYNKKVRRMLAPAKNISTEWKPLSQCDLKELERVYIKYLKYKNFALVGGYLDACFVNMESKVVGEFREDGVLRGFVISRLHHESAKAMTSIQFCWDYENPRLFLGKFSIIKEIEYCKEKGFDYLYMGDGYQSMCEYKSSLPGFEFWTGKKWSKDAKMYKKLLHNDDKVKTVQDLDKLSKYYIENQTFKK